MASWGVWNTRLAKSCSMTDMNISRKVGDINTASFVTTAPMDVGDVVSFRAYVGPTTYITPLTGTVLTAKQNAQKLWECQAVEGNDDLRYFQAEYAGSRTIDINNSSHTKAIKDYVAILIAGTGWIDGTRDTSLYIPNTTEYLPSMRFSNSFVSAALDKFLKYTCGYDIWCDSSTKTIYYGEIRTDRSSTTLLPIQSERTRSDAQYNVSRIIVYGMTNATLGIAIKTGATAPYRTMMYRYADAKDSTECQKIAMQILNDRQYTLDRYESHFTIEQLFSAMPYEGDKVHVHSPDVSLDDDKGVKDVTFTMQGVTLGLGYAAITIFDLLGNRLTEVGGSVESGSEMLYSGGWQNIGSSVPTDWNININDITKLSSFVLSLNIAKWKTAKELASGNAAVGVGTGYANSSAGTGNAHVTIGSGSANVTIGKGNAHNSTGAGNAAVSVANDNTSGQIATNTKLDNTSVLVDSDTILRFLGDLSDMGATTSGRHFGMLHCVFFVYTNITAWTRWSVEFYDGSGARILDRAFWLWIPPASMDAEVKTASISILLPWKAALSSIDNSVSIWAKKYEASDPDCRCQGVQITSMQIGRHGHTASDSGHSNHTVTDSGHSNHASPDAGHSNHASPDSGHSNHAVNDAGHSNHPGYDSGHGHTPTDDITEKNSYPTNINVYLYNTDNPSGLLIKSDSGGSEKAIDIGDVTEHLCNGDNWISVESATVGSGWLSGTFTSFGE